jgi:hypothetical protein
MTGLRRWASRGGDRRGGVQDAPWLCPPFPPPDPPDPLTEVPLPGTPVPPVPVAPDTVVPVPPAPVPARDVPPEPTAASSLDPREVVSPLPHAIPNIASAASHLPVVSARIIMRQYQRRLAPPKHFSRLPRRRARNATRPGHCDQSARPRHQQRRDQMLARPSPLACADPPRELVSMRAAGHGY